MSTPALIVLCESGVEIAGDAYVVQLVVSLADEYVNVVKPFIGSTGLHEDD
jgi:hypothetical protein